MPDMNSFSENPFFFFVDNAQPVFPVNVHENVRKVVELTDAGCDARNGVVAFPRNANRIDNRTREVKPKNTAWKWVCDDTEYPDRYHRERLREEVLRRTNNDRWFPRSTSNYQAEYEDYIPDEIPFRREPETSEKRWKGRQWGIRDKLFNCEQNIRNVRNVTPKRAWADRNVSDNVRPKSGPKYDRVYSEFDDPNFSRNVRRNLQRESSPKNFQPVESFGTREPSGKLSRSRRDCWRKTDYTNATDKSFRGPRNYERYDSRDAKSPKGREINVTDSMRDNKTRSRTCSPPKNRRNRTRSVNKPKYQNVQGLVNGSEGSYQNFGNNGTNTPNNSLDDFPSLTKPCVDSDDSCPNLRQFVERSVDADSLSNISKVSNSCILDEFSDMEIVPPVTDVTGEKKNNLANSFWEFIPLEDEINEKEMKTEENYSRKETLASGKCNPTMRNVSSNKDCATNPRMERSRTFQKDNSRQEWTRLNDTDSFNLDSTEKSNRFFKRPNSGSKTNPEKKKKMVDTVPSDYANDKKMVMNFVEKTAACLKRKLEKPKAEISEAIGQSLPTKEHTRLPVKIGNRFRSKNLIATHFRGGLNPSKISSQQVNNGFVRSVDIPDSQRNSDRSRTKPRAKPSVPQNAIKIDPVESGSRMSPERVEARSNKRTDFTDKSFYSDPSDSPTGKIRRSRDDETKENLIQVNDTLTETTEKTYRKRGVDDHKRDSHSRPNSGDSKLSDKDYHASKRQRNANSSRLRKSVLPVDSFVTE